MLNIKGKKILLEKSPYNFVNQLKLSELIKRVDKRHYDINVIDKPNYYLIVSIPKIEEV